MIAAGDFAIVWYVLIAIVVLFVLLVLYVWLDAKADERRAKLEEQSERDQEDNY